MKDSISKSIKAWTTCLAVLAMFVCGDLLLFACGDDAEDPHPEPEKTINFVSNPKLNTDHNRLYTYKIESRFTKGDTAIYNVSLPDWLSFNAENSTISGLPGWPNLNRTFNVSIRATNKVDTVLQAYVLEVILGEIICDTEVGDPSVSEYILPFEEGEEFLLSQGNCPSDPTWGHHNWFAYDFDMPIGTRLIAMRAGVAIAVIDSNEDGNRSCNSGATNYLFILHDDGSVAIYAHQTKNGVAVSVGERVEQGDFIGLSGDSGCSIGPHVHVGVYKQRGPYDRQYTLPINFRNAEGPLSGNNGLIQKSSYKALGY